MNALLDANTMMSIKDLSLAAQTIVDGFMSGLNHSKLRGAGITFSQYRNYIPGDDLRNLDWKVFARTGRHYIRQSETEQTISVRFMVDATASMAHDCGGFTKLHYAKYLTAALALLVYRQGDSIGLTAFSGTSVQRLQPAAHGQQLQRIYHTLQHLEANGRLENLEKLITPAKTNERALLVIITDCHEHQGELTKSMKLLLAQGHEIILLHVLAANELAGSFQGYDALEDLETGEIVVLSRQTVTPNKLVEKYLDRTRKSALENRVYYRLVNTRDTPANVLRDFLMYRIKRRR